MIGAELKELKRCFHIAGASDEISSFKSFHQHGISSHPFLKIVLRFFNATAVEIVNVQGVNALIELKRLANEYVKILCYMCVLPLEIFQDEALG